MLFVRHYQVDRVGEFPRDKGAALEAIGESGNKLRHFNWRDIRGMTLTSRLTLIERLLVSGNLNVERV